MRILLVYTKFHHKFGVCGTSWRLAQLTELYAQGNDLVSLVGLSPKAHSEIDNKGIYYFRQPFIWNYYLALLSDFNLFFLKKLKNIVVQEKIDLIIIMAAPYGVTLASIICGDIPVIYGAEWVSADMPKVISKSPIKRMVKPILQTYVSLIERLACKRARHIVAISEIDKQRLVKLYGVNEDKITVIPPHVSSDKFEKTQPGRDILKKDDTVTIVFHGPYQHPANREAFELIIDYIAPQVKTYNSNVQFILAGPNVPMFDKENVKSVGFVDDLQNFLRNCDIAIVPLLQGVGIKVKIFDYIAAGLPIIATRKAAEGIDVKNGKDVIITDKVDQQFVQAIADLANNDGKREMLGRNALALAKAKYGRESAQVRVDEMLAKISDRAEVQKNLK